MRRALNDLSHAVAVPVALFAGAASPAAAQQAMSTSMAECAVIYDELTRTGTAATSTPERRAKARGWSDDFAAAALEQAVAEGVDDPQDHVRSETRRLEKKWRGRFGSLTLFRENKDWLDYCRKFGRARGIVTR